jgi:hypothetical protein
MTDRWRDVNGLRERAARFDGDGNKTANAVDVRVEHNGVVVHENEEVTGPTRAAMFDNEEPLGRSCFRAIMVPWRIAMCG